MSVDVIIPAHNAQDTIERAVLSALGQDYDDLRIHIFDDASTDNTRNIVEGLSKRYANVDAIFSKDNVGAGVARNTLLKSKRVAARYIAFLDSDDQWHPNKISKQVKLLENTGYAICHTNMSVLRESGSYLFRPRKVVSFADMKHRNWIPMSSAVVDAELRNAKVMPQLRKRQDYAYWLTLFRTNAAQSICLEETLTYYDDTVTGISGNKFDNLVWNYRALRHGTEESKLKCMGYVLHNIRWFIVDRLHRKIAKRH